MTTVLKNEQPFYTHPCDSVTEDHARHVVLHQYVGCIRIASEWSVPANNSAARLSVPALVDVLIGSCLWNPQYGAFRITSYDRQGMTVTVERKTSSAQPGTVIPSCTKFIFTPDT